MGTSWTPINDDFTLKSDDQIRVAMTFNCAPLSKITASDIAKYLNQQQAIRSVLAVDEGWLDSVTLGLTFECSYIATLNPQPGVTAASIRNAAYTALTQANNEHIIKSDDILVGVIERAYNSILPDAPKTTTAVSLAAVAIIAIVALVLFMKVAD